MSENKLRFLIKPNMSMSDRMMWIGGLLLAGFVIQLAVSPILGWLVFLAGCALGIIESKSTKPAVGRKGEWSTTTIEELERIEKLSKEIRDWREQRTTFSPITGGGCGTFLLGLIFLFVSALMIAVVVDGTTDFGLMMSRIFAPPMRGGFVTPIWVADVLALFIPIWLSGSLAAWEPPELPRKVRYLLEIYRRYKPQPELEFLPSLYVQGKDGLAVPTDARLMIKFKDAPKEFMGVQVQVSLNDVQGRKYPYAYSVLLAKKEFGLIDKAKPYLKEGEIGIMREIFGSAAEKKELAHTQFAGSIAETESQEDVDVVVVRQIATGQGYHTSEDEALEVISDALNLAQLVLKS